MPNKPADLCKEISLRARQLEEAIAKLMKHQNEVEEGILELQRKKRKGDTIDEDLLDDLKKVRKEAGNTIGLLSQERSELFDDLPTIEEATGELKVVASELEKDAQLVEKAAEKIKEAAKKIQKAEELIPKIISFLNKIW